MRTIWIAAFVLLGCGGGEKGGTAPQQTGTVQFAVDAQTCTGSGTIRYYMDGTVLGEAITSAGQAKQFTVPVGSHVFGAEVPSTGYQWPSKSFTILPNTVTPITLKC